MRHPYYLTKNPDTCISVCYHFVMGLDNDKVFQELFDEQLAKIPGLFRTNKKRRKVQLIILAVLAFIAVSFIIAFYGTGRYEHMETAVTGRGIGFNNYDYEYLIMFIITMIVIVVLALWMVITELLEKRAFAKASRLANMIYLSERHRNEIKRQNDRLLKRY